MNIKGVKKAVGTYKAVNAKPEPFRGCLMLDRETGEVWTDELYGYGTYVHYTDGAIINLVRWARLYFIGDKSPVTMGNVKIWAEKACDVYRRETA